VVGGGKGAGSVVRERDKKEAKSDRRFSQYSPKKVKKEKAKKGVKSWGVPGCIKLFRPMLKRGGETPRHKLLAWGWGHGNTPHEDKGGEKSCT